MKQSTGPSINLALEPGALDFRRRRLAVGGFKLGQIALDARFDLLQPLGCLGLREILVARLTALNLLPSMAAVVAVSRPARPHTTINSRQTLRMAGPLSCGRQPGMGQRLWTPF
jgi:hypothetical protein